jgi:peptidoglycan/xylan/chitin deacetylase (PgdA/CDA1 family)
MAALSQYSYATTVAFPNGLAQRDSLVIAVTFDDGYKDNLYNAAPVLLKYNIPFTVFISPALIESGSDIYLTRSEVYRLASMPQVTIGSHGMNHIPLTECDDAALKKELVSSKLYLEDLIGYEITTIAYPYGAANRKVRDAAEQAGYRSGATIRFDINNSLRDPLLLCRTEITGNDSVRVFLQKLHGTWDWYRWRRKDPLMI